MLKSFLVQTGKESDKPLYFYSDGSVSSVFRPEKLEIGRIWGNIGDYDDRKTIADKCAPFIKNAKIGDFVYSDGKISSEYDKNKTLTGIIYWINIAADNISDKALCITLDEVKLDWGENTVWANAFSHNNGKENTKKIISKADKECISIPAAHFCHCYNRNGLRQGECYLPSINELRRLQMSRVEVNESLKKISPSLELATYPFLLSSTEVCKDTICAIKLLSKFHVELKKSDTWNVRPVFAL